jgi:hypothetical protein
MSTASNVLGGNQVASLEDTLTGWGLSLDSLKGEFNALIPMLQLHTRGDPGRQSSYMSQTTIMKPSVTAGSTYPKIQFDLWMFAPLSTFDPSKHKLAPSSKDTGLREAIESKGPDFYVSHRFTGKPRTSLYFQVRVDSELKNKKDKEDAGYEIVDFAESSEFQTVPEVKSVLMTVEISEVE